MDFMMCGVDIFGTKKYCENYLIDDGGIIYHS